MEIHCLRDCVTARLIWDKCELNVDSGAKCRNFADWASVLLEELQSYSHGLLITTCWAIWKARNRWIFDRDACNPNQSMEYVLKLMKELQKEEHGHVRGGGSSRSNGGASVGVIVRDSKGAVKFAVAWRVQDCWEPAVAEAKAILMGLQAAVEFGLRSLMVESDSLSLITAIKSQDRGGSSLHIVLDDIYDVSGLLNFVSWSFTRREGNKVAHELAHCLPRDTSSRIWFSNFPSCIIPILELDLPMNES
ncbi:uncharacterized protein LOC110688762 [Chenopodium quinoa]|uniref:uncharacterized protein LOC110688762 n=1 Tax=Chenopodium quinoa TaxID=63459 RepID=UPI000B78C289|nr:uncharacterized protein LOC110688762 [Chenopodium quinoa]